MKTYDKSDFVDVVDAAGNAIPGMPSVPKAWLGTDLVPPGTKKGTPSTDDSPSEPAGNASREEWEAYARQRGATDADLVDDDGQPLGQDALRDKFGSSS